MKQQVVLPKAAAESFYSCAFKLTKQVLTRRHESFGVNTRQSKAAKKLAAEYFERYPKDRYQTEVESWRHLQSRNYEFTMKRLREPVGPALMK